FMQSALLDIIFSSPIPLTPRSPLFPYTTLFRSEQDRRHRRAAQHVEPGLLHAAVRDAQRLSHRVVDHLGQARGLDLELGLREVPDRKSTRLNSSHVAISYAVFCLKKQIW